MDLKESVDLANHIWTGDKRAKNDIFLKGQRDMLVEKYNGIFGDDNERKRIIEKIEKLDDLVDESQSPGDYATNELKENCEIFIQNKVDADNKTDDLTTRMLPELPEQGLMDSLYELFADVWEDDLDQKKVEEIKKEIENNFPNLDDRRELIQGYIDDHRLKSRIFLSMTELVCYKSTNTIIQEKPAKTIELFDEKLIRKLDDTFYNFISVDLDKKESDESPGEMLSTDKQEMEYMASTDIDKIIRLIERDNRNEKEMANFLTNYHFDLKTKIKYFYKILVDFCKKPLDVIFEPQEKLTEKDLKNMLEDFGFGKYLFNIIEFEGKKHERHEEKDKTEEKTFLCVKPIAYDSSEIKTIGNGNGGQKLFYQFENLFEKSLLERQQGKK